MEALINFLTGVFKGFSAETAGKIFGYGLGTVVASWIVLRWKRVWNWLTTSFRNSMKLKRARDAVESERGIWLSIPLKQSSGSSNSHHNPNNAEVTVVANLKGGVGKTTVAANLIAHCAIKRNQNVLGIDFDYQGSLTAMALPGYDAHSLDERDSRAGKLISGKYTNGTVSEAAIPSALMPRAKFIPSDYPLAQVENRLMVSWLLNDLEFDVRTKLQQELQNTGFNKVIIDAPPRLTTSCVQALCASTHIIVPTILDRLSTQAVGRFVEQIYDLRRAKLIPGLKKISVVGTMIDKQSITDQAEHDFITLAMREYSNLVEVVPFEICIPTRAELEKKAGHNIVYAVPQNNADVREIRDIFDALGHHIW